MVICSMKTSCNGHTFPPPSPPTHQVKLIPECEVDSGFVRHNLPLVLPFIADALGIPRFLLEKNTTAQKVRISQFASKCIMLCAMSKNHSHHRVDEWPTSWPCLMLQVICHSHSSLRPRTIHKWNCSLFVPGALFPCEDSQAEVDFCDTKLKIQGPSFAHAPSKT